MNDPRAALAERIAARLAAPVDAAIRAYAAALAAEAGACAVLFYGSNLRTGSRDGVLDFYVLRPGTLEAALWPRVSFHERAADGEALRAKVATMTLATFVRAARGESVDTTIWARFVQPSALVWAADGAARREVIGALADAASTAARLAAALGPDRGDAAAYWRALFRATYAAELRVEGQSRADDIFAADAEHFAGLLPLALAAGGVDPGAQGATIAPQLPAAARRRILGWWARRRRLGKLLNALRLIKASTTFAGAARYAAWKIERHTGLAVTLTPLAERFPLLAAPAVLWHLWRRRRRA